MADTYSSQLKLIIQATGSNSGSWGTLTNTNIGTLIEQAISGYVTQAVTDGAATTLTIPNGATGVARNMTIELTGALTAARVVEVPTSTKLYFIYNNTTGGYAVTVRVNGQTGVSVPNGKKVILTSNGTDIVEAVNQVVGNFAVGGLANIAGAATLSSTVAVGGLITHSGGVNTVDTLALTVTGGTTGARYSDWNNTTGRLRFGVENSAGGGLATGSAAYSSLIGTNGVTSFHIITNGIVRATIDSAGAASFLGALAVTGAATLSSTLAVTGVTTLSGGLVAKGSGGVAAANQLGISNSAGTISLNAYGPSAGNRGEYYFYGIDSAGANSLLLATFTSAGAIIFPVSASPASNGTGTAGTITWDASYIYVCTATNTWKRVAITGGY